MFKKSPYILICFASVLLFGCTVKQNAEQFYEENFTSKIGVPLTGQQTTITQNQSGFNRVAINGPYDVQIISSPPSSFYGYGNTVTVSGDSGIVNYTHTYVKNQTLKVFLDPDLEYQPPVHAKVVIHTNNIKQVYMTGIGSIDIQNVQQDYFSATINGDIYMSVSGQVNRFDATATGAARLNAKSLLSTATFVNTTGTAQAEVLGGESVSGLAADSSDIYYYNRPDAATPYQRQEGSVVSMYGILPPQIMIPPPAASIIDSSGADYKSGYSGGDYK